MSKSVQKLVSIVSIFACQVCLAFTQRIHFLKRMMSLNSVLLILLTTFQCSIANPLLSSVLEVSEKQVAATFWNGELEIEVRGTGQLDFYGLFHKNDDREAVMEEIERRRSQSVYVHCSEDCSQDCKKRGMFIK